MASHPFVKWTLTVAMTNLAERTWLKKPPPPGRCWRCGAPCDELHRIPFGDLLDPIGLINVVRPRDLCARCWDGKPLLLLTWESSVLVHAPEVPCPAELLDERRVVPTKETSFVRVVQPKNAPAPLSTGWRMRQLPTQPAYDLELLEAKGDSWKLYNDTVESFDNLRIPERFDHEYSGTFPPREDDRQESPASTRRRLSGKVPE